MNWAVDGLRASYDRLGSRFDAVLRERDMIPTARKLILRGLEDGACVRRGDGSIYIDLTEQEMGEVTLLRADGTGVAYTQLLGA